MTQGRLARVISKFAVANPQLAVGFDGTNYSLYSGLGSGLYWRFDLVPLALNIGSAATVLQQLGHYSCRAMQSVKQSNTGYVVKTGTWNTAGSDSRAYGATVGSATITAATGVFTT